MQILYEDRQDLVSTECCKKKLICDNFLPIFWNGSIKFFSTPYNINSKNVLDKLYSIESLVGASQLRNNWTGIYD